MQLSVNSRVACARGSSVIRRSDPVLDPDLILSATARIPLVVRLIKSFTSGVRINGTPMNRYGRGIGALVTCPSAYPFAR